jgi:ABC-2 type transport system permease protein
MTSMEMNVQSLWKQRFDRHAKETIGYWQYAIRSNFIGFLLFLVIVSSYYYSKILQHLPTTYPYIWIFVVVLVPLLVLSPIRTLLREPDRMFLLRVELQMSAYFRGAFVYSFLMQSFFSFLALVALWPLYRHCEGALAQPFVWIAGFVLIIKTANLLVTWQESQFVQQQGRIVSRLFRYIVTFIALYLLFLHSPLWSGGFLLVCMFVWLIVFGRTSRYQVNWEYLIEKEKQQQARLYAFFNWFIDVPHLPARIRSRGWISGITAIYPFRQSSTYMYLYTKTMLRTELFGIVERITVIGGLAIFVLSSDTARSVVFFVVVLITTVQLSSLGQAHRYTFWLDMYPLERSRRAGSLTRIVWWALAAQTCLLTIPFLIRAALVYAIVPVLSLVLCSFICGVILRRKFMEV